MVEFFCENRFLVHCSFLPLTFLLRGKADFWEIQCPGGDDKNLGEIFAWGTWVKISRFNLLKTMKYGNMRVCISLTLGKKCQIRSFLLCLFSRIRTEYGEILYICPHSVRMRGNTDQKKLRIWTLFTQCEGNQEKTTVWW